MTSDAFSQEKRDLMRALGGAHVIEIESEGGRTTEKLIRTMIEKAEELSSSPDAFIADQFNNPDVAVGYAPLANEVWEELSGEVDAFVQSVGTAQCINGISAVLRQRNPEIEIIAVEPAECPVLSGGASGPHKIEGIGPGFVPPLWTSDLTDDIQLVSTDDAKKMAR